MELIFFLGAIIFIAYVLICRILNFLDNTAISNGILAYTDQDEELIKSVTDVNRGTNAEKKLIVALLKSGIHPKAIFHDLYIPRNNGKFSQIDLVAATKVGILVFEVKDYSGWIYGNGSRLKWTQVLAYGREKYKFYNPVLQNNSHIKCLRQQLKEKVPFYSIIVFYGDCQLKDIDFIPKGTYITKWYRVLNVVNKIINENPPANYKDKIHIIKTLKSAVERGNKIDVSDRHLEGIKDMLGTDRIFQ